MYGGQEQVHVHGHASQEELKLLLNVVKPKFFMPIHGEYRDLTSHANLAQSLGISSASTFELDDGDMLELSAPSAQVICTVLNGDADVHARLAASICCA